MARSERSSVTWKLHLTKRTRIFSNVVVVDGARWQHSLKLSKGGVKKPTQEFVPCEGKVLARPRSTEPLNRMNPRYKYGIWLRVRNNGAECCIRTTEGAFMPREIRGLERHHRGDKETINSIICVLSRFFDGRWSVVTDQRPELTQYRQYRHC